jgi:archaellum biogenesis ATPase FlaH
VGVVMAGKSNVVNLSDVRAARSAQAYEFTPEFERVVVTMACCQPHFYGRIASQLDAECMSTDPAKLAMRAAHAVARDVGHGPDSAIQVVQRIRRWMREGSVTQEQLMAVGDLLDAAEDGGLMSADAAVAEIAPLLKRRMRFEAVKLATSMFGKGEDEMAVVTAMLTKAERVGISDESVGTFIGASALDAMTALRDAKRMRTGILELDDVLDGGFIIGTTIVYLGESSSGKSMALVQGATSGALQGLNVCYATFELAETIVLARIMANITGVPTNDILFEKGKAERAFTIMEEAGMAGLGTIVVKGFTPQVSTVFDVLEWVANVEKQTGKKIDVLVVDYGDKVAAPKTADGKDIGSYKTGLLVFEAMRVWADANKRWCITASQAKRGDDKRKKLDLDDVADSMHKVRVVPVVITLNARGEQREQMMFNVAKNTLGKAPVCVGPLPTEFHCARIAPVMLEVP